MSTYHFEIDSDGATSTEVLEAADQNTAVRQALLLISEILRDHALSSHEAVTVRLRVRGAGGHEVWRGLATGGHTDPSVDQVTAPRAPQTDEDGFAMTKTDTTPDQPAKIPPAPPGDIPASPTDGRLGPAGDPAEGKREP